jgi:hypothetical protein
MAFSLAACKELKVNENNVHITTNEKIKNYKMQLEKIKKEEDLNRFVSEIEYSQLQYDFKDGSSLVYKDNAIVLNYQDGATKKINTTPLASRPYISPDEKRFVFIDPNEADCPGNLYLYDREKGKLKALIKSELSKGTNTPKRVRWIDDNILLVVIGYGYGTHNLGGSLYIYNIKNSELKNARVIDGPDKEVRLIEVINNTIFISIYSLDNKDITNLELDKEELLQLTINEI